MLVCSQGAAFVKTSYFCSMGNLLIEFLSTFQNIPEADQALIADAVEHRVYKEGDVLFTPGRICRELFFICNGLIRIKIMQENGQEVLHSFIKENRFCSILNSFVNQVVAKESIEAACDLEVMVFNRDTLYDLYKKIPYLQHLITQITSQALMDKIALRNSYLGKDAETRYRAFIDEQSDIATRVSMSDIASYLGITPQSLSRIRKNLR